MPLIAAHEIWPEDSDITVYNGLDALTTFELNTKQKSFPGGLLADYELGLQACTMEMMLRGFKVDPAARELATKNAREKLIHTQRILKRLCEAVLHTDYNPKLPNSNQQLRRLFYDTMGIPQIKKYSKGEISFPMDRDALEQLENYFYPRPIINAVLLHRDLEGVLEVLEKQISPDMRWRCSYNIAGTATWRFSSSQTGLGDGGNFQNITEELRRPFIADRGMKLCGIDREQVESREVGWFCGTVLGDWSYLDAIETGDVHTLVCRYCWPELPWTGDPSIDRAIADRKFYRHLSYRDMAKKYGHGSNYMGTARTMAQHTKTSTPLAQQFQDRYFAAFSCIPRMHTYIARELQIKRYLINSFGARRDFFDRPESPETIRSAVAHMFQSAAALRTNLGMWRLWKHMGSRIQLLAQLHDAVYFQFSLDDREDEVLQQAMRLLEIWLTDPNSGRRYTVPGEAQVGFNWAHRFKYAEDGTKIEWNPRGLDKIRLDA